MENINDQINDQINALANNGMSAANADNAHYTHKE